MSNHLITASFLLTCASPAEMKLRNFAPGVLAFVASCAAIIRAISPARIPVFSGVSNIQAGISGIMGLPGSIFMKNHNSVLSIPIPIYASTFAVPASADRWSA